jgi:hypothetical protein
MSDDKTKIVIKPQKRIVARQELVKMLKQGNLVVINRKTGQYMDKAFGLDLVPHQQCIGKCLK